MNVSAAIKIGSTLCSSYHFCKDSTTRFRFDVLIVSFNDAYAGHYHIDVTDTDISLVKVAKCPVILFSMPL